MYALSAKKLDLNPDTIDSVMAEAIQKMIDSGATKDDLLANEKEINASLVAKLEEITAQRDQAVEEVEAMKSEADQKEFESAFVEALKGEIILPAEKEEYQALYKSNKELCMKTLKKFSVKKEAGFSINNSGLSDEDRNIMLSLKMNPDDSKDVMFYKRTNGIK